MFRAGLFLAEWLAVSALSYCAVGCSSAEEQMSQPTVPTHIAKGKIKYDDGSPVTAGVIEFVSVDGSGLPARAEIAKDGTFSLSTIQDNGTKTNGAKSGKYRVSVMPPMSEKQTELPASSSQEFTLAEGQNELTVTIPKQ